MATPRLLSEAELWKLFRKHPSRALRRRLAELHQPLVEIALKGFRNQTAVDLDELRSAGNVALIKQIDKFDPTLGNKFSSFARKGIRGGMLDVLRGAHGGSQSGHGVPEKVERVRNEMTQQFGRPPTEDELAERLGFTYQRLLSARRKRAGWQPLRTAPVDDSNGDCHFWEPQQPAAPAETDLEALDGILEGQPPRVVVLVYLRFALGMNYPEMAALFGRSPQWAQRHVDQAIKDLRRTMAGGSSSPWPADSGSPSRSYRGGDTTSH